MDMSRIRIEGLLAAFPKLIGTGKQHTFVETENVRYIYQPMEVRVAVSADLEPGMVSTFSPDASRAIASCRTIQRYFWRRAWLISCRVST